MKARAVALRPPATSKTTPRSHVNRETWVSSSSATAANRLTAHGSKDHKCGGNYMPTIGERLVREEGIFNDFSADVVLERD
jgi:hypothetical protein